MEYYDSDLNKKIWVNWNEISKQTSKKEKRSLNRKLAWGVTKAGISLPFSLMGAVIFYGIPLGGVGGTIYSLGALGYYALTKDPDTLEFVKVAGPISFSLLALTFIGGTIASITGGSESPFDWVTNNFDNYNQYRRELCEKYKINS